MRATFVGRRMASWAVASGLASLGSCALVILVRSWSGAISFPLAAGPVAAAGAMIALGVVLAWRRFPPAARRRPKQESLQSSPTVHDRPAKSPLLKLEYRSVADGALEVSGRASVSLSPGQTTAHLHVAFCPPFARTPTVEARVVAPGVAANSKLIAEVAVGKLFPWGMRLDVKLAETQPRDQNLELQFRAHG